MYHHLKAGSHSFFRAMARQLVGVRIPSCFFVQAVFRRFYGAVGVVLIAMASAASAQSSGVSAAADTNTASTIGASTQQWVNDMLSRNVSEMPLRMEVEVGTLDPRLHLAPCSKVEPYLPQGAKLWGRTRLGLRCVQGDKPWNVFLPMTVKAFGPAWVLTRPIPPGTVLTESDATQTEVDWALESSPVVALQQGWLGQTAARYLPAGQALRSYMVKAPELFKAGAQVKVVAQGPGYAVTSGGQALMSGTVGATVRVRMSNGKVIAGVVGEDGSVDVPM